MSQEKLSLSQRKKIDIVNAAKKAFQELGVQNTTMNKISELAKVSKRTVYNHFESKEVLVMYILKDMWNNSLIYSNINFYSNDKIEDQLFELLKNEIDLIASKEYIDLFRVALGYFFYNPEELKKEVEKYSEKETTVLKYIKHEVKNKRLIVDDIIYAKEQLHSLMKGSCFWPQVMQIANISTEEEKVKVVNETVKMFILRYKK